MTDSEKKKRFHPGEKWDEGSIPGASVRYFKIIRILLCFGLCLLFVSCNGITKKGTFENIPVFHNKIFSSHNILFCKVPVPASVSGQSQTHPSICYIKGKWNGYDHWLATTPYPKANDQQENPCIYFSNSVSNIPPVSFTGIPGNPILKKPERGYNSDVELIYLNNCLYSLIRTGNNGIYRSEIKVQKSANGFEWSSPVHVYSDKDCMDIPVASPAIIQYHDKLRIYHLNSNAGNFIHSECTSLEIMEGTSLDAPDFKWLKFGHFINKDSVKIEPWHMDLFEYNDKLYMVFCGRDMRKACRRLYMETRSQLYTYLAVSDDYENFRIFPKPLINDFHTYRPTAYVDENGYFNLYFSVVGHNGFDNSDRSIGLARMKMEELLRRLSM